MQSQRPALDADVPGVVEHDTAIQDGGVGAAGFEERSKVVKQGRAAIEAARKAVVTLRVPQAVVVNLRIGVIDAVERGIGPVDRPVIG